MTYRVRLQPRAQRDLHTLFLHIRAESSQGAAIWFNGMADAVASLEQLPHRCAITPESPSLRHLLYGNKPHIYRIIFRVDEPAKTVDVLHIRHGARDTITPSKL